MYVRTILDEKGRNVVTGGPQLAQAQSRLASLEAESGQLERALARLDRLAVRRYLDHTR